MIFRTVVRLIGEVAAWTALVALAAAAVAVPTRRLLGPTDAPTPWVIAGATLAGALLVAGLSDRFGLPQPFVIHIGRRPLPVVWVLTGAVVGAAALWISRRRTKA